MCTVCTGSSNPKLKTELDESPLLMKYMQAYVDDYRYLLCFDSNNGCPAISASLLILDLVRTARYYGFQFILLLRCTTNQVGFNMMISPHAVQTVWTQQRSATW